MIDYLIKKTLDWDGFQLTIDTKIFSKNLVLKAAYNFLDRWYFLFILDENKNIIVQCKKKEETIISSEKILLDFSDELLNIYLRSIIDEWTKSVRDAIILATLNWSIDVKNYISKEQEVNNLENIDAEIDSILNDLKNDPELKVDEEEIKKIISEINNKKNEI